MNRAILLPVIMAFSVGQNCFADPTEDLIRKVVTGFYDWYVPLALADQKEPSSNIALRRKPELFHPFLLKELKKDAEAQAAAKGEIDGLDFDPFLNTQDPAPSYMVGSIRKWQGLYWVEVFTRDRKGKRGSLAVTPQVAVENGNCVFVDFYYPKGGHLQDILRRLHPESIPRSK
ncbi:hypothetical protein [Geothrix sp.]|uniref:hypothetical protein n=1 Tax=Geothrix sp. TaxID=1962974 RepID=UPI002633EEDA|nr:hypothetical protein [Geothrix sp.]WIL19805.1 MAG: YbjP/YqhG family protein [Geothrix sp.]WIL21376.1 MAG: YbjP/YqhG family protein [Geothrix sp.]